MAEEGALYPAIRCYHCAAPVLERDAQAIMVEQDGAYIGRGTERAIPLLRVSHAYLPLWQYLCPACVPTQSVSDAADGSERRLLIDEKILQSHAERLHNALTESRQILMELQHTLAVSRRLLEGVKARLEQANVDGAIGTGLQQLKQR